MSEICRNQLVKLDIVMALHFSHTVVVVVVVLGVPSIHAPVAISSFNGQLNIISNHFSQSIVINYQHLSFDMRIVLTTT